MSGWKGKSREENPGTMKLILVHIPVFILGILSAVIIPLILESCSISDSRLIHAGPPLTPTNTAIEALPNGMFEYHIKHGVRLFNTGWRKGHVQRVEVARDGLKKFPEKVTVLYVNQTDLVW